MLRTAVVHRTRFSVQSSTKSIKRFNAGAQRPNVPKFNVPGVKHMIAVASGKGGVGKTTVATNVAAELTKLGKKVGILDADIYGPSIPTAMGLEGKLASVDPDKKKLMPLTNHGIVCMSMGFLVSEATAIVWRGPMVISAIRQLFNDVEWGELDVLVIDMPPGTGDAQLTIAQSVPLDGAVIVSTPQSIALADVVRGINMFEKVKVPVLGVVENMSYFKGEDDKIYHIFGQDGAKNLAEKMNVPLLGDVPIDTNIRKGADEGCPLSFSESDSLGAKSYKKIAENVLKSLEKPKETPEIVFED